MAQHRRLTLLTSTQDMDHSHTAVLAEWLTEPGSHDERRPDAARPEHGRAAPGSGRPDTARRSPPRWPISTRAHSRS
ncbi:hypothetical protein [Streptomyces puniciscabiei]|uniref:hypothetical protein n=1 Tax=Streptomyces puniciscabiei TaxID=164348 RepID=UPI003EBFB640